MKKIIRFLFLLVIVLFVFIICTSSKAEAPTVEPVAEVVEPHIIVEMKYGGDLEHFELEELGFYNEEPFGTYKFWCNEIKRECTIQSTKHNIYIDPVVAIAISRLETGNWSSWYFENYNNFGGICGNNGFCNYDNWQEGLSDFIDTMAYYTKKYGDDLYKWQEHYCPNPEEHWADKIYNIMKEI